MKRRTFIKVIGGTAGSVALFAPSIITKTEAAQRQATERDLPKRSLGKTGIKISSAAFSGFALNKYSQEECNNGVKRAFEKGINYFDVAPAYGESEIRMGIALQEIERSKYYLACKTKMRDGKAALEELERSLKRLKTDYFDVYQMHHLRTPQEVEQAFAEGGVMETLQNAKKQGKIRFIGFSAHTTKAALEAMKRFNFDTVMFPISFVEYYQFDFGKAVLEEAKKQGAGVLAIKALSTGLWHKDEKRARNWWYRSAETQEEVNLVTRFPLSFEQVSAIFAPSYIDLIDKAIEAAKSYRPMTEEDKLKLKEFSKNCLSLFKREEDQVAFKTQHNHNFCLHYC